MNLDNDLINKLNSLPNDGEEKVESSIIESSQDDSSLLKSLDNISEDEDTRDTLDAVSSNDIKEEHEVKAETDKNTPPSQDSLYSLYSKKYPDLFLKGELVDIEGAEKLGIITPVSAVPLDEDSVTQGHVSTVNEQSPFGFAYNTEAQAVANQQQIAKDSKDFRRIEKVSEDFDVPEMSAEEEDKFVNNLIESMPDTNPNGSINLTKKFFEITGSTGYNILNSLGMTFDYIGAGYQDAIEKVAKETQEAFPDQYNSIIKKSPKELANEIGRATMVGVEFSETVPVLGIVTKLPAANARIARKLAIESAKNKKKAEKAWNRRLNVQKMKGATAQQLKEKQNAANKKAKENKEISNRLITEFEETTGKTISQTDDLGNKTLDYDLARKVGQETAEELDKPKGDGVIAKTIEEVKGEAKLDDDAVKLFGQGDTLFQPILKPDKFDGLVAVASELMERFPKAFDNKKTIIDNLLDLTVKKQLIVGDELLNLLNKYNLSFEDYILSVVGSGSAAGRVLNKLSQIKRTRPVNEKVALAQSATIKNQDTFRNTFMRIENIRRGGLVSQLATAARNLTSAGIRAPLEGLGNVMDTALYNLSNQGAMAGAKSLLSKNNWQDSFRHMRYMFDNPKETKEVVDFILEQPELKNQYKLLFDNINEIMISTGRGTGSALDKVLTVGEDAVMAFNIPNRWQEFLVRRGAFLGELERLVKREYGIDFIDTIGQGKIRDLLNDAGNLKPENARSFGEIVADATQKALDVTYAKQPDIPVFRSITSFIVRNGLTVVAPFPRFMFNSMELMGQYAGGALIPLSKKIVNIVTKNKAFKEGALTAKDRQRISRNIVGSAAGAPVAPLAIGKLLETDEEGTRDEISDAFIGIAVAGAAYQYRTSEDAPADYKKLKLDDGTVMDTTPQFPLRQFLYLGELVKRVREGTFEDFFDSREFLETFAGTNFRTGVGQSVFQDMADIISTTDLSKEEKGGKALGQAIGQYLSSWFVPFAQVIEAQRAVGERGLTYKDVSEDPNLDFQTTFMKELQKPFKQRGLTLSPEEEEKAPKREFLFAEEKKRVSPQSRVLLGLNLATPDSEEGEYLQRLGFTDFELGSKSGVPSIRRFETKILRSVLPILVDVAKSRETQVRNEYRNAGKATKDKYSEQAYVNIDIRALIKEQLSQVKRNISDISQAQAEPYVQKIMEFRKLPPSFRRKATAKFYQRNNRAPDVDTVKDLSELVIIGKTFQKAF